MGMTVYQDIVTGDELISDSFDPIDINDVVYEVNCAMVSKGGESYNTGANASAEEADEGLEDSVKQVNNVVDGFRLQEMAKFTELKGYQVQFKGFLKKAVAEWKANGKTDEEIKAIQGGIQKYFSDVIKKNFKDYDFYTGESMDPDGMVLLLNYREDGVTPYFTVWKHALKQREKMKEMMCMNVSVSEKVN